MSSKDTKDPIEVKEEAEVKAEKPKRKRESRTDIKKRMFLKALEETLGVVAPAAKKVRITRDCAYKWKRADEVFSEKWDEIIENGIDFVEMSMFKQIKEGSASMTQFYLKTKGKHRGYFETQVTLTRDVSSLEGLSDAELIEIINKGSTGGE